MLEAAGVSVPLNATPGGPRYVSVTRSGDASNLRVPPEVTNRHGVTKSDVCADLEALSQRKSLFFPTSAGPRRNVRFARSRTLVQTSSRHTRVTAHRARPSLPTTRGRSAEVDHSRPRNKNTSTPRALKSGKACKQLVTTHSREESGQAPTIRLRAITVKPHVQDAGRLKEVPSTLSLPRGRFCVHDRKDPDPTVASVQPKSAHRDARVGAADHCQLGVRPCS